jgi:hypothetical protein
MVTPVKPLALDIDGRTEELHPGSARLSPAHWAVREHPEWFRPCMKDDRLTANRMRELHQRADRIVSRELGGSATTRKATVSRRQPYWRLGARRRTAAPRLSHPSKGAT